MLIGLIMLIINGVAYEAGAPELSLLNRSFKYGDGLFETIRVYGGKALFVKEHLDRLLQGMKLLQFETDFSAFTQTLATEINRAISLNAIARHGRIRLHIYRSGLGAYAPLDLTPYYLIEAYSLKTNYYEPNPALSYTLVDFKDVPLAYGSLSGLKTASSLPYVLAAIYAQKNGVDDVVLYCDGCVSEASSANIFIAKNQKIYTPPLSSSCRNGVMRAQIIRLCKELKIDLQEKNLYSADITRADEVFLSNTIRGIIPIKRYNQIEYNTYAYAITPFLQKCLLQYVGI